MLHLMKIMFLNSLDNYEAKKACLIFMIELVNMILGREVGWDLSIHSAWRPSHPPAVRGSLGLN